MSSSTRSPGAAKDSEPRSSARPLDEPPMHALRVALAEQIAAEDPELLRRWIAVIAATPSVVKAVLGGIQLNTQRVIAEFFGATTRIAER